MSACRRLSRLDLPSTLHQLGLLFRPTSHAQRTRTTLDLQSPSLQSRWTSSWIKVNTDSTWLSLSLTLHPVGRVSSLVSSGRQGLHHRGQSFRQSHTQAAVSAKIDRDEDQVGSKRPLIHYTPPGPPLPGQKHQTLTLYTITPIPEENLEDLREELFLQLVRYYITGRIYLAKDGINLHLCTPIEHLKDLQLSLQRLVLDRFGQGPDGAIWNFSCEEPGERVFRKLKVAVKKQLVADGRQGSWSVQDSSPPQYLEPKEFHARLDKVGGRTLLIDMRNHFENEVGRFKDSVKMDCTTFKENMDLLDELLEGRDKSEEVMMVCTGGIRCSISGRYLSQKGFKDVKMLKGGITSYGRWIQSNPDIKSHFLGKNFTFDGRRGERITTDVLSTCHQCHTPHDDITNCANTRCHLLFIQCPSCRQKWHNTCGPECHEAVETRSGPALSKPYDYHAQVRPGRLLSQETAKAA